MGECQAVVAQAVQLFGRVDILLCCTSQSTHASPFTFSDNGVTIN